PSQRIVLRAQAPGATPQALSQAVLATHDGLPIELGDVATVQDAAAPRFGDAIIDGQPGILVETSTQYDANTLTVTRALEQRLNQLAPELKKEGVIYHPALLAGEFHRECADQSAHVAADRRRARGDPFVRDFA